MGFSDVSVNTKTIILLIVLQLVVDLDEITLIEQIFEIFQFRLLHFLKTHLCFKTIEVKK